MSIRTIALIPLITLVACSSSKSKTNAGGEYAQLESPVARARLEARVENLRYQRGVTLVANLERIVAYGEAAIPVCLEGLRSEDAMTRMGCSYALGRIGDTRTIPALTPLLEDEADFVRYEAASALGAMGSRQGYAALVRGLEDERIDFRWRCIEALRDFTGQDYGYSHNAAPESRKVAVEQWQAWLQRVQSEEL